jgi:hypothetical protein
MVDIMTSTSGSLEFFEEAKSSLAREHLNAFVEIHKEEIVAAAMAHIRANEAMENISVNSLITLGPGRSQGVSTEIIRMGIVHKLYLLGRIVGRRTDSFMEEICDKNITFEMKVLILS